MAIKAVLFDFIGTTVMEKDPLTINKCFSQAFNDHEVPVTDRFIIINRGKDKKEVIMTALKQTGSSIALVDPILNSFKSYLEDKLDNFFENTGAKEIIAWLKDRKISIGIGTGLPRDIFERIFNHLPFDTISFDYIGIADEIGKGRPHPDMILDMLVKCQVRNNEMLKVGDTISDIQEGRNANVFTAVILSGTQDKKDLINEQPDHILHSLIELKEIINTYS
jgi:phosphonoacetaldehyde hydrolase